MSPDLIHSLIGAAIAILEYFLGKTKYGSMIGFVSAKVSAIFKKKEV